MVMRPDVLARAIDATATGGEDETLIFLTPRGAPLTQDRVRELSTCRRLVIVCGRFEGVDERVIQARGLEEISIGDYVLSGGEPAAIVLVDACVRLLPGVVHTPEGLLDESFETGLLEYPHYTRPGTWEGRDVPEVLLSGHHERVRQWRRDQAEQATRERRPDLWTRYRENGKKAEEGRWRTRDECSGESGAGADQPAPGEQGHSRVRSGRHRARRGAGRRGVRVNASRITRVSASRARTGV